MSTLERFSIDCFKYQRLWSKEMPLLNSQSDVSSRTKWAATWDFQQCGMCDKQRLRPACSYAQTDQSICKSLKYYLTVKLQDRLSLRLSKCHIDRNHMLRLKCLFFSLHLSLCFTRISRPQAAKATLAFF